MQREGDKGVSVYVWRAVTFDQCILKDASLEDT